MFRQNKWKAIIGIAVTTPPTSADPPPSRLFKMKLGSNPTIQVDRTVDVTYANAGSHPMLTKPQNWVRTECGSEDIEMQGDIFGGHRRWTEAACVR